MSDTPLPTLFYVDPDNTKRDLTSPEMKGLIEQGYTIGPAMLWQDQKGQPPKLALIMVPRGSQAGPLAVEADRADRTLVRRALGLLVALSALQAVLLIVVALATIGFGS